jgi:hypothetical protein
MTCLKKQNSCKSRIFCNLRRLDTVTFEHGSFKSEYQETPIKSTSSLGSVAHMILETYVKCMEHHSPDYFLLSVQHAGREEKYELMLLPRLELA